MSARATKKISEARIVIGLCLCLLLFMPVGASLAEEHVPADSQKLFEQACNLRLHFRQREYAAGELLKLGRKAYPILIRGIHSKRSIERQVAAIMLGDLGDLRAEKALLATTVCADFVAGDHAKKSLAKLYLKLDEKDLSNRLAGKFPEPYGDTKQNQEFSWMIKGAVLDALYEKHTHEAGLALSDKTEKVALNLLAEPKKSIRAKAAKLLGLSGEAKIAKALAQRTKEEKSVDVLIKICRSFGLIRMDENADLLESLLQDKNSLLRLEAAAALFQAGRIAYLSHIRGALQDDNSQVKCRALELLGELGGDESVREIALACADVDMRVRIAALKCLSKTKVEKSRTSAVARSLLADTEARVRAEAAKLLYSTGNVGAAWSMIDDLHSKTLSFRLEAAHTLGELRVTHKAAVDALGEAASDKDLELACRAVQALGHIATPQAESLLKKSSQDTRLPVAALARAALGKMKKQ